jgi:demethylmenaquinone methyltransferase/2-methoxy-6-polyprenyl-1,4-benzoquinol methylase
VTIDRLLDEQIAYYRARAGEYDQWFLRQGRYDQGPELNERWRRELEEVYRAFEVFGPRGRVLELAGGTGLWTERLLRTASVLTVVDASPEVLAINRARLGDDRRVRYVLADLFAWRPEERYDAVVFTYWLSHVPPEKFEPFWAMVADALGPGGRVFFVDSLAPSTASGDHQPAHDGVTATRRLNDGREFRIYKLYYRPDELVARLGRLGWMAEVRQTPSYFLYGTARRV